MLAMTQFCRPALAVLPDTEGRLRAPVPGWLRPVFPPGPVGRLAVHHAVPSLVRVVNLFNITSALPTLPARLYASAAPQQPPARVVPRVALPHRYRASQARTSSLLRASSATLAPSLPWLAPEALTLFHEYGVQASPVTAPAPLHDRPVLKPRHYKADEYRAVRYFARLYPVCRRIRFRFALTSIGLPMAFLPDPTVGQ